MKPKTSLLQLLIVGLLMIACQPSSAPAPQLHEEKDAAEDIYLMPGLEHGLMQSPINILSREASDEAGKHNITFNFSGEVNKVENLGHTIQLDFEPGNTITADGRTYEFKQLHFHTPSEHLIDGVTYPLEMHIVNVMPGVEGGTPQYLVIGFLFKMGATNPFIASFIDAVPDEEHTETEVNINVIKSSNLWTRGTELLVDECYHYRGSLTTPPYTESVYWLVHKEILEASPEQIIRINEIEGDNARHIQSQADREISSN